MLPTGELLVYNITRADALKIYRCRTHHKLTQDSVVSGNVGKIQLTGKVLLVASLRIFVKVFYCFSFLSFF